ncbi:hypothetical protein [Virgibacillus proomii]|jgi:hypothetical protein|nr:hypothetical protein [Virgibacillus proomii]
MAYLLAIFPERIDTTFLSYIKKRLAKWIMDESYEESRRDLLFIMIAI